MKKEFNRDNEKDISFISKTPIRSNTDDINKGF